MLEFPRKERNQGRCNAADVFANGFENRADDDAHRGQQAHASGCNTGSRIKRSGTFGRIKQAGCQRLQRRQQVFCDALHQAVFDKTQLGQVVVEILGGFGAFGIKDDAQRLGFFCQLSQAIGPAVEQWNEVGSRFPEDGNGQRGFFCAVLVHGEFAGHFGQHLVAGFERAIGVFDADSQRLKCFLCSPGAVGCVNHVFAKLHKG